MYYTAAELEEIVEDDDFFLEDASEYE